MNRIFLSHSSADNESALALSRWLAQNGWDDHFLDLDPKRGIAAGEHWLQAFLESLSRCEAVIFLLSPAWCRSRYCRTELDAAKGHGKRLFGVMVEPVALEDVAELSADWQVCDLTGASETTQESIEIGPPLHPARQTVSFGRKGLESLAIGLRRAGLDPGSFPWPPAHDPGRRPYRGLRALDRDDAAVFFGRDAAIVRLLDRLQQMRQLGTQNLLVILGASGAGKSSFLRAGLLPRLERDSERYVVLPTVRPEVAVLSGDHGLLAALGQALADAGRPVAPADLRTRMASQNLGSDFDALAQPTPALVREAQLRGQPAARRTVILPVDQAEELFSSDSAAVAEFTRFCDMLTDLRRDTATRGYQTEPAFIVVLTIRSDTLPTLQACPPLMGLSPALESLEPMPATEFKAVVDGPARRHSAERFPVRVEAALSERLIAESEGADALPLLALTLEALYAQYERPDHRAQVLAQPPAIELKLNDYDTLGGVRKVIAGAVARAFARPDETPPIPADTVARDAALHALFALVATVDPSSHKARRVVATANDIARVPHGPALMARLEAQRLLVRDRRSHDGQASVEVIEVAHEALMRQWERFDAWLTDQQARLIAVEGVRHAAADWLQAERADVLLVHASARLRDAEDLRRDLLLAPRLAGHASEYLEACQGKQRRIDDEREAQQAKLAAALQEREVAVARQTEQQRLTARVQRRFQVVLATGFLLVLALGGWTINQSRYSARQTSLVLAAASLTAADREDFVQASRLAVLATHPAAGPRWLQPMHAMAFPALVRSVAGTRLVVEFSHAGSIVSAHFSTDSTRVVTASADKTARIWDTKTGLPIGNPMRHEGLVWSARFSPDGQRVVTASEDKTARLWDAKTGLPIGAALRHEGMVRSAEFSPDSLRVVTASMDMTARLWNTKTGLPIGTPMRHEDMVKQARFSPDGMLVMTTSGDKVTRFWEARTGQPIGVSIRHEGQIMSAHFSTDSTRVVTASADKTARLWDTKTGQPIGALMQHQGSVMQAQFSPDGRRVVTASADKTARLWDAKTGHPTGTVLRHEDVVIRAEFSIDNRQVLTASIDGTARLWDTETGRPIGAPMRQGGLFRGAKFSPDSLSVLTASDSAAWLWDATVNWQGSNPMRHEDAVLDAQFSPDGQRVVTASEDNSARLWNAKTGLQIGIAVRHGDEVLSAKFSPDGQRVLTVSKDMTSRLLDANSGQPIGSLMSHEGVITNAKFSPDGQRVVTVSKDKVARLWDAKTGQPVGTALHHDDLVWSVDFSADGQRVVTASKDKTARLWDAKTGQPVGTALRHEDDVWSAKFSADGQRVVTASSDKTARLWDAKTGQPVGNPLRHKEVVLSAQFSPDGQRVVTAAYDSEQLWDAKTGLAIGAPIFHEDPVWRLEFSPDGQRMVAVTSLNTSQLWDVKTSLPIGGPMRHEGPILHVQFSPDGQRVVTASNDKTARLWDANTGQPVSAPLRHEGAVRRARFSADGQWVVTASEDNTARLWNASWTSMASAKEALEMACRRLPGQARLVSRSDVDLTNVIDTEDIGQRDVCSGVAMPR